MPQIGICLLFIFQFSPNIFSQKNVGYCQDFETFNTCLGSCNATCNLLDGWSNESGDDGNWIVDAGGTSSESTGPSFDVVPGSSIGNYIYLESSSTCNPNKTANMLSPELDLLGTNAPFIEFYYHMYGATMGTLHIDVSSDNGVTFDNDIDMISGDQGDIWFLRFIDLSAYVGDTVRIRFRGVTSSGLTSDMAIDFFCFKDLLQIDAGVTAIDTPSIPNCAFNDDIYVSIENFGTDSLKSTNINWEVNSMSQSAYNWTGALAKGEKDSLIKIGTYDFQEGDTMKIYTSLPNGVMEIPTGRFNDTTTNIVKTGLSGLFTIGPMGDYVDFTSAVNDLEIFGLCGPVVFEVDSGTYTQQIVLKEVANANATNSITFVSASGDYNDVILTFASSLPNENFTAKFDGGDYFKFEYITIESTGSTYGRVLDFSREATHNTFSNCLIRNATNTNTTSTNMTVIWSPDGLDHFNTFFNNTIEGGSYGVYWGGAGILPNQLEQGTMFDNNLFLNQYYYGARLSYQDAPSFTNNTIESNSSYTGTVYQFYLVYCDNDLRITGNQLKVSKDGFGIYLNSCDGTPLKKGLIANNFIHVGDTTSTSTSYGIYVTNSGYQRIVHNNVNLESNGVGSRAIYFTAGGANEVLNNNFVNTGPGYAFYLLSQYSVILMDHNNLYAPNGIVGYFNTDQTTLADFQAASDLNTNGLSVDPLYFSQDDLHLCEPALYEAGTPLAYIADDIDKEARGPVPDIGADEFFSIADFSLGPDQLICPGDTLTFYAGTIGDSTFWSTGDTALFVKVTMPGQLSVFTKGPCGEVRDTIELIPSNLITFYIDQDGDGLGDPDSSMTVCIQPAGYVTNMNDCDDNDDGIGVAPVWYKDGDNDGYTDGTTQSQCARPNNYKLASELLSMITDCNDGNANIHPGANELCNGLDDDCDMQIDENIVVVTWYYDMDMDGFGDATMSKDSCNQPMGYVQNNNDCDDSSGLITIAKTWYKDIDGDGYTDSLSLEDCIRPPLYKLGVELAGAAKDCDDLNPGIHPGATEICNGIDDNCDGNIDEGLALITWYYDFDGDGYGVSSSTKDSCAAPLNYAGLAGDCDDTNAGIYPGASDVCNGIDDDCDLQTDEDAPVLTWYQDNDMDGFGDDMITKDSCDAPVGYTDVGGDCDDANNTIHPDAQEVCNGLDDNCDGFIDEGLLVITWYPDTDGDGFGDGSMPLDSCAQPVGYVNNNDDCDDSSDLITIAKLWYKDIDGDGYTDSLSLEECIRPPFYKLGIELAGAAKDCDDLNSESHPGAIEICNGIDDNCDGNIDEGLALITWYYDFDGDGYGISSTTKDSCAAPLNYAGLAGDCNDMNAGIYPGASDVCNGIDDDCDLQIDEDAPVLTWYRDSDMDGFGDDMITKDSCDAPLGYTSVGGDCDDTISSIHPDAIEVCNGLDDNCDGFIDEGLLVFTWYPDTDGDGFGDGSMPLDSCAQPVGYVNNNDDCDDTDSQVTLSKIWFKDLDDDGFTDSMSVQQCMRPPFYKLGAELAGVAKDCNDLNPDIHPGAIESCNGLDDNCDGNIDEGLGPLVLQDPDFIYGDRVVCPSIRTYEYFINPVVDATDYDWTYSGNYVSLVIMDNLVSVEFDNSSTNGLLSVTASRLCASTNPIALYITIGGASQCNYSDCTYSKIYVDDDLLQSTGVQDFKAQTSINSPARLNQGLQYKFQAGVSIDLNIGFEVPNNAIFDVNIGPCQD